MLLQQAASSSAFAVVLRVTPVTCPWTLQTSGPHVYCTLTRTITQKYKLGLSHRGPLLKGVAVQGVLYQSILNAKLTGRKKLGRKCAQATGMTASLRILSSKADSNT